MAARSIASLSLSFGLVSIPVKLYSATESSAAVRFNMLDKDGARLKQQYVSEKDQHVVERAEMVKGYEFEKDRFVIFQPEELKALQESPSHTIDIVAFIPDKAIDPIFYDKAYYLAPDKRGGKPYNLLMQAMRESGRVALAKWAWKAKQYVVQVRPAEDGLVLQQLLYADEVRSMKELDIEKVTVSPAELKLAMQLIEQISEDTYDPTMFEDEEKKRILSAIDEKIAGKQIVANEPHEPASGGAQVIDLVEALRASLGKGGGLKGKAGAAASATPAQAAEPVAAEAPAAAAKERKGVKRAAKVEEASAAPAHAGEEVTSDPDPSPYTIRALQEMLGLSRGVITGLIASGFVAPSRGPRNEYRFTFREVVLLRTAVELQAARIPPRKILASLRKLKATLPAELPLTGLRITAVGNDVTVRDGRSQWHADTGQLVMDFELAPAGGNVTFLQRTPARATPPPADAAAWFSRGEALEASDRRAAEAAYRRVLAIDPGHADAYLNLGALLCESRRCDEAVALYDEALKRKPDEALLHFNRAIALEDRGDTAAALASYHACLRLSPDLADAHYNAARLHQQLGDARQAVRHFNAYRRLQPPR